MKCEAVMSTHTHALVSVSGGADSDVMLDLVERVRTVTSCDVTYVWLDTGLEWRATRTHVGDLEGRYGIRIERRRADVTIPVACKRHGVPFVSKYVSDMIAKLQSIGFGWEDEPYPALLSRYGAQTSALKWWSNAWTATDEPGWYDIGRVRWLREFLRERPPTFAISAKCCDHAKKRPSRAIEREAGADVLMLGVRRAEGGVRAAHKTCFDRGHGIDTYRPLFWLSDADRGWYAERFGVTHSDCYRVWGFSRTGCVGCPLNSRCSSDLAMAERYEPNMVKAALRIFGDSYAYTAEFADYRDFMRCGMLRLF
jgi:3'-phosphoadenosine 5'-phosphosulfate sulfotransferase (PAPS reductase)/FAD synthetase